MNTSFGSVLILVNADMWGAAGTTKCCANPDWLAMQADVYPREGVVFVREEQKV
jgi:hypothetical protein